MLQFGETDGVAIMLILLHGQKTPPTTFWLRATERPLKRFLIIDDGGGGGSTGDRARLRDWHCVRLTLH